MQQFNDLQINVGSTEINPLSARNLGVIFDSHLNLESHINTVCRSAYFHLRNIRSVRDMLTDNVCSQLIHTLVTVCIDYCNSLLYGLLDCRLSRLQRIMNTAARILCKIPKFYHITKTLLDLQWIHIHQRILFKILILTYQAYHKTSPQYLCDLIIPHSNARNLRSDNMLLIAPCHPRAKLKSYGERCSNVLLTLNILYILLYCILLYYILLYCIYCYTVYIVLLYILLYCILLYCILIYCILLYCILLYCILLYCISCYTVYYLVILSYCSTTLVTEFYITSMY